MKKKITIAIDAMGGDNSPSKTVAGVGLFLKKNSKENDFILNLFGDEEKISGEIKKMNITSIFDLGRPEVVKAMDSDGNGKGEFWIGADGWASANVNEIKVRDYKLLDAGIEPIRAAEAVKNARVLDSIKKGEGYAFYCYKPHAIWGMADVVMLEEPKHDPAKYKMVQPKADPDWKKKSYVASKDALKQIQIGWATSLEKQSPAIVEFFNNFQLTADDVSSMAYAISVEKKDPAAVAKAWMDANKSTVDGWLGL